MKGKYKTVLAIIIGCLFLIQAIIQEKIDISAELEKQGLFIVPLAKGLRVSVASISEEKCRKLPAIIKAAMDK